MIFICVHTKTTLISIYDTFSDFEINRYRIQMSASEDNGKGVYERALHRVLEHDDQSEDVIHGDKRVAAVSIEYVGQEDPYRCLLEQEQRLSDSQWRPLRLGSESI